MTKSNDTRPVSLGSIFSHLSSLVTIFFDKEV
jgi:hypothetical protein